MKNKVYKITKIDNDLIDLYIECFKKDKIFTSRDKEIIKDRELITKLFDYYLKYGTILYTKRYSKKISFLCFRLHLLFTNIDICGSVKILKF